MGEKNKTINMLFYKSLCHRRALFCSKAGPLANGLLDVLEMLWAACHKDTHEWAGFNALATNAIVLRRFSHLIVPCSCHHCLLEVALSQKQLCKALEASLLASVMTNATLGGAGFTAVRYCVICRVFLRPQLVHWFSYTTWASDCLTFSTCTLGWI